MKIHKGTSLPKLRIFSFLIISGLSATTSFEADCGVGHNEPCKVFTYDDLIKTENNGLDRNYVLMNDIPAPTNQPDSFIPIGRRTDGPSEEFQGSFDGNGHTIHNLYIDIANDRLGLFADLGDTAVIRNLILKDPTVIGSGAVGALAGYVSPGAKIHNVIVDNPNMSGISVGALAGVAAGDISCCHAHGGTVNGVGTSRTGGNVGGLVGLPSTGGSMKDCSAEQVNVTATGKDQKCGGLVGSLTTSVVENSFATGNVKVCEDAGGLVGVASYSANISSSYSVCDIRRIRQSTGGLVGRFSGSFVKNSFAVLKVFGLNANAFGCLIGRDSRSSRNQNNFCYTNRQVADSAQILGELQVVESPSYFLEAKNEPMRQWSFPWTFEANKYPSLDCTTKFDSGGPYNGTIDKPVYLKRATSLEGASYFWTVENSRCSFLDANVLKPSLTCSGNIKLISKVCLTASNDVQTIQHCTTVRFEANCGEEQDDPCEISTYEDLKMVVSNGLSKHYILVDNINAAAGDNFYPIGPFTGSFDGNGHVISDLHINRPSSNQGLFGYVTDGAEIRNLILENPTVSGNSYVGSLVGLVFHGANIYNVTIINPNVTSPGISVGGLVGMKDGNYGKLNLTCCHVQGGVVNSRGWAVGGLLGFAPEYAHIEACSAEDTSVIGGNGNCGGLVGLLEVGTIVNSFATGNITNCDRGGGLVGFADGLSVSITNCYALGHVSVSGGAGGGLIGTYNGGPDHFVKNSFATGTITGGATNEVGGLIGSRDVESLPQLINNYCLVAPAVGSYDVQDSEARIVESTSHFQNELNQPVKSWDRDVWALEPNKFPALSCVSSAAHCSVPSCMNSTFMKKKTDKIKGNLNFIKYQLREIPTLLKPWKVIKKVRKAKQLLVKRGPLTVELIDSARNQLNALSHRIRYKVKSKEMLQNEQEILELKIEEIMDDVDELEAKCCDL